MKLLRDDMVRTADADPLELFEQGIRSNETRARYARTLRQVTCEFLEDVLEGTYEERVAQLVRRAREDPGWARDLLISLARKLRERTRLPPGHREYLNPSSFGNYFHPIKKLFAMNDVVIQWKRVHATFPELDNVSDTDGWTMQEIAAMLRCARDAQDRAIILVLASSGVRAGALNQLNWGDLTPIYWQDDKLTLDPGEGSDVACAMLEVYRGSTERYTAFITPEAFAALREYGRAWAERMGRQAGPEDPMFIAMRYVPKRLSHIAIRKRVEAMVERAGLREEGRRGKMHRVPLMNGFRRFWNKTGKEALAGDSSLGSLINHEFMMGHRGLTSLDENYYKANALEMAADYVKAVPDLTIDDAYRLRRSNRIMAENIQNMEDEKDSKMTRLEAEAERMRLEMERVRREKDEAVESVRKEMAEMRDSSGATTDKILSAVLKSPKSGGVPGEVMESLTTMMKQLGAAQETAMRDMKDSHDAAMADMRAEHDAKMGRLLRVMDRMAKESDSRHDPLAEFRGDGA